MGEMIERVKNAIMGASFDALGPGEAESYAKAAIEAMREPTPQMLARTLPTTDTYNRADIETAGRLVEQALFILEPPTIPSKDHARGKTVAASLVLDWRNMIDAALK